MAELEIRLSDVEKRQDTFETTVRAYIESQKQRDEDFRAEMRDFKTEMREFKTEMRDRDNQRAAEIREIRQSQEAMRKDMYALVDRMDQKIDGIGKFVQNLTVAAIVGIGAAVVGIGAVTVAIVMK